MTDAERVWQVCAENLRSQLADATWKAWFDGVTPVAVDNQVIRLAVPSSLVRERLETRYMDLIRDAVAEAIDRPLAVELEVHTDAAGELLAEDTQAISLALTSPADPSGLESGTGRNGTSGSSGGEGGPEADINPRYTFDAFVIGDSNRFAHAAALSVAETPARSYNPLFVQGGAGLGKTHLLHAIGNYVRENFPGRHVRYVSTETFLNEFVDAIRTNSTTAFKKRYRECDVLLVDDIQFMEGKERLQEEFFHTFNSLHGASKQIVITSDRPPRSLATLEDRLRSRFLSGLVADVQPPELETRLAILRKKAEGERTEIPHDVLEFIATNVTSNIRELEGALIRVAAYASLNHYPLTRELAEQVLGDIMGDKEALQITPKRILEATAAMFEFSVDELQSSSRRRPLVIARQISMYVFRELTDYSYPAIAREFGGRDHTTVIHAVEKITALMKEKRQIYDQVTALIHAIRGAGA